MRKLILWIAGVILSVSGYSQVSADIGLWGGASGYLGDIEDRTTLVPSTLPVVGGFFMYNYNQRASMRFMILWGNVEARGPVQGYSWSFEKKPMDLSLQAEINYLKYAIGNKKAWFTSYLTAGVGVMNYGVNQDSMMNIGTFNPYHPLYGIESSGASNKPVTTLTLPFGMGFKFSAGKRLEIGVEYQMRKLFNDKLDDLDDPLATWLEKDADGKITKKITYTDFYHNNDWTGFLGLHLTYKIYWGGIPCPAYDLKQ